MKKITVILSNKEDIFFKKCENFIQDMDLDLIYGDNTVDGICEYGAKIKKLDKSKVCKLVEKYFGKISSTDKHSGLTITTKYFNNKNILIANYVINIDYNKDIMIIGIIRM